MEHLVYVGLGSNLGDRQHNIDNALARLADTEGVRIIGVSSSYLTQPEGYESSNAFYNSVAALRTTKSPLELLLKMKEIESHFGRSPAAGAGYSDRIIDIDLLWCETIESISGVLTVPHPRAHQRAFVLVPWAELAPDVELRGRSVASWLSLLDPAKVASVVRVTG